MTLAASVVLAPDEVQPFLDRPTEAPARPTVLRVVVEAPTLVLGSTQPLDTVDLDAAAAAGVAVARRRSGGGAVLHGPEAVTWLEVVLGRDDHRWDDDVARSSWWLGDAFAAVLADLGAGDVAVHRGPLVRTRWSPAVCFGGLGPGEVTLGGRKVVGIAQRRSRAGARFQCAALHRWDPSEVVALLPLDGEERAVAAAELAGAAAGLDGLDGAVLAAHLAAALAD